MPKKKKSGNKKSLSRGSDQKTCAVLAYLLIGILWYFADSKVKADPFAKFHVKQAIVLYVIGFAGIVFLRVTFILAWMAPFWQVLMAVFVVIGIINAAKGLKKELPWIGKFSLNLRF